MSKLVIFQPAGAPVAVFRPSTGVEVNETVGAIVTPEGEPFWVVDESEIPTGETNVVFRDAWTIEGTQTPPDGYGVSQKVTEDLIRRMRK